MGKGQPLIILWKQGQNFIMAINLRAQQELRPVNLCPSPVISKSCVKFLRLGRELSAQKEIAALHSSFP